MRIGMLACIYMYAGMYVCTYVFMYAYTYLCKVGRINGLVNGSHGNAHTCIHLTFFFYLIKTINRLCICMDQYTIEPRRPVFCFFFIIIFFYVFAAAASGQYIFSPHSSTLLPELLAVALSCRPPRLPRHYILSVGATIDFFC